MSRPDGQIVQPPSAFYRHPLSLRKLIVPLKLFPSIQPLRLTRLGYRSLTRLGHRTSRCAFSGFPFFLPVIPPAKSPFALTPDLAIRAASRIICRSCWRLDFPRDFFVPARSLCTLPQCTNTTAPLPDSLYTSTWKRPKKRSLGEMRTRNRGEKNDNKHASAACRTKTYLKNHVQDLPYLFYIA